MPPDIVAGVDFQPLTKHVQRLIRKLEYLGAPLPTETVEELHRLIADSINNPVVKIQETLDRFCLASVMINPESRVKSKQGPTPAKLYQNHPQRFLVKIINEAGVTSRLALTSDESKESNMEVEHTHAQKSSDSKDLFHLRYISRRILVTFSSKI